MRIPGQVMREMERGRTADVKTGPPSEALIGEAAHLARLGLYGDAETIIAPLCAQRNAPPAILDLYARALAQQGRYAEAQACWLQAVSRDPGNPAFGRGLQAVAQRRTRPWTVRLLLLIICVGVGTGVGWLAWFAWHAQARRYEDLRADVADLRQELAHATALQTAEATRVSETGEQSVARLSVAVEGLSVRAGEVASRQAEALRVLTGQLEGLEASQRAAEERLLAEMANARRETVGALRESAAQTALLAAGLGTLRETSAQAAEAEESRRRQDAAGLAELVRAAVRQIAELESGLDALRDTTKQAVEDEGSRRAEDIAALAELIRGSTRQVAEQQASRAARSGDARSGSEQAAPDQQGGTPNPAR